MAVIGTLDSGWTADELDAMAGWVRSVGRATDSDQRVIASAFPITPALWICGPPGKLTAIDGEPATVEHVIENITIARQPTERRWLPLASEATNAALFSGALLRLVASHRGLPPRLRLGHVTTVDASTVHHDVDTEPGSGGGALLDDTGRVVAVHLGSKRSGPNFAHRISDILARAVHLGSKRSGPNFAHRISDIFARLASENPALHAEILNAQGLSGPAEAARRVAKVRARRAAKSAPTLKTSLEDAAAVLWSFDPAGLRPTTGGEPGAAPGELWAAVTPDDAGWSLQPTVRKTALGRLGTAAAMRAARAANADVLAPAGSPQWALDALIAGDALALDHLDATALDAVATARRWLAPHLAGLPEPAEIAFHQSRARLYHPLTAARGDHFKGRVEELAALDAWLALPPPPADPRRQAYRMTAAGGAGKSALIGKWVLDHVTDGRPEFPFVYLDFDRPGVPADDAVALVVAILERLAALRPDRPDDRDRADAAIRESRASIEDIHSGLEAAVTAPTRSAGLSELLDETAVALSRLASAVAELVAEPDGAPPVLIVLDSYEEVQPSASHIPAGVPQAMLALQTAVPTLRVLVTGRATIAPLGLTGPEQPPHHLDGLDALAADGYLEALGVTGADDRALLVELATGNPLVLKLGAKFVREHGASDLRNDPALRGELAVELVQGVLYRRILDHVGDADVEALAHPGLVLRRITVDAIQHVLAEPCGLGPIDAVRARELFDALASVGSLVDRQGDQLVHRPDVRRVMSRLLAEDQPDTVQAIDAAAHQWYGERDPRAPWQDAERLYHALRLELPTDKLDSLWSDTVKPFFTHGDLTGLAETPADWLEQWIGGVREIDDGAEPIQVDVHQMLVSALHSSTSTALVGATEAFRALADPEPATAYLGALTALRLGDLDLARTATDVLKAADRSADQWRWDLARAEALELAGDVPGCLASLANTFGTQSEVFDGLIAAQRIVVACQPLGESGLPTLGQAAPEAVSEDAGRVGEASYWASGQPLRHYLSTVALVDGPGALQRHVLEHGLPGWSDAEVDAVLGRLTDDERAALDPFAVEATGFVFGGERADDDLRRLMLALPELPKRWSKWVAQSIETHPAFAALIVALVLQLERGPIYRRLRAWGAADELSPQESR